MRTATEETMRMRPIERLMREAIFSMNPQKIRDVGRRTGHEVSVEDDEEVVKLAAEMIVFHIPDAPLTVKLEACVILGLPEITIMRGDSDGE